MPTLRSRTVRRKVFRSSCRFDVRQGPINDIRHVNVEGIGMTICDCKAVSSLAGLVHEAPAPGVDRLVWKFLNRFCPPYTGYNRLELKAASCGHDGRRSGLELS